MADDRMEKEEMMQQIEQEIAVLHARELMNKMSRNCFNKCVVRPGVALNGSEKKCVAMCMDRFLESWYLISRTYSKRLQREQNGLE